MFFSNRRADLSTPTRGGEREAEEEEEGEHTRRGGPGTNFTAHSPSADFSFCFSGKSLGIVKLLAFDAGISDFMSNKINFLRKKVG